MDILPFYYSLKPENVLIDEKGYIKITDFGLSKRNIEHNDQAKSICGTPEYLAPEILLRKGHGKVVDWWTLGAIIYEMFVGIPPFYITENQKREELFHKIKWENVHYPKYVVGNLKDLLDRLLQKIPEKRLGFNGAKEIKEHPWFAEMNWDKLIKKEYQTPFVPKIKHDMDVNNFDSGFFEIPINSDSEKDSKIDQSVDVYDGFTMGNNQSIKEGKLSQEISIKTSPIQENQMSVQIQDNKISNKFSIQDLEMDDAFSSPNDQFY